MEKVEGEPRPNQSEIAADLIQVAVMQAAKGDLNGIGSMAFTARIMEHRVDPNTGAPDPTLSSELADTVVEVARRLLQDMNETTRPNV